MASAPQGDRTLSEEHSSYGQILRSSSIMGGAQAVNYIVGLVKVKAAALLLGPAGVGMIGLYVSATNLLGIVTEVGLRGSSVRSIVQASSRDDPLAVARTIRMLRRLCWATGIVGWLTSIALAVPLSRWMFQSTVHAWALGVLGGMLLLNSINGGQFGLLQGLRRIGDIARVQVGSAVASTAVTIGLYVWLGESGIVPALLATAAITLTMSWWFTRRVRVPTVTMGWREALAEAKPLLGLGFAMMWSGVVGLVVDLFTRSMVSRHLGVGAAGIYQAAWALSGAFASFVLAAMGTDFYPRLTVVISDHEAAVREVNEQTEIGILLALPGLLLTIALAKWVVWALYSAEFTASADVLVWMVLAVYGRVISWPLAYIQLAKGAGRWFIVTESLFLPMQFVLVMGLVPRYGVVGSAYAFIVSYAGYTVWTAWVGHRLIGFKWTAAVWRIVLVSTALVLLELLVHRLLPSLAATMVGSAIALIGGVWCLRGLVTRLGKTHRLVRWILRVPGVARVLGV